MLLIFLARSRLLQPPPRATNNFESNIATSNLFPRVPFGSTPAIRDRVCGYGQAYVSCMHDPSGTLGSTLQAPVRTDPQRNGGINAFHRPQNKLFPFPNPRPPSPLLPRLQPLLALAYHARTLRVEVEVRASEQNYAVQNLALAYFRCHPKDTGMICKGEKGLEAKHVRGGDFRVRSAGGVLRFFCAAFSLWGYGGGLRPGELRVWSVIVSSRPMP